MLTYADFHLGRMSFPTLEDALKEALGDSLDVTGAALTASERKPRPWESTIPVRASSSELNPYAEGDRMRRQLRSLMENPQARLSGLYMMIDFDPELNGWVLVGGGNLEYDQGGVTMADYKLSLSDSYVVAKRRTHRPARNVRAYDRRLLTTPRDFEGSVYSTAFAGTTATTKLALPSNISDLRARGATSAAVKQVLETADGGIVSLSTGLLNGDVLSFEQPESGEKLGDVVVLDRRGNKAPAELMSTEEPQATFGWEEVYGPDYPLSEGDIPVLQNGLCRIRYLSAPTPLLALDQYVAGTGWVERQRIVPAYGEGGWPISITYAAVKEWTVERAAVFVRFLTATGSVDCYITLQRGWTGPRIEAYTRSGVAARAVIYTIPTDNSAMVFANSANLRQSSEAWSATLTWAENDEPWGVLAPTVGAGITHQFATSNTGGGVKLDTNTKLFGSTRLGLIWRGTESTSVLSGWGGVDIRLGPTQTVKTFEAELYDNAGSATSTEVEDGTASGGKTLEETQAAETANTLLETTGGTAIGLLNGSSYALWARARVVTGGATASLKAFIGATAGSTKTTTATAFTWVFLGVISKPSASSQLKITEWRSAGAGVTRLDRVVAIPFEVAADDAAADVGSASLYDTRGVPELVAR